MKHIQKQAHPKARGQIELNPRAAQEQSQGIYHARSCNSDSLKQITIAHFQVSPRQL